MFVTREIACCGMREIGSLSAHRSPEEAMKAFAGQTLKTHQNFRYVIFSEAVYRPAANRRGYGRAFAAFIRSEKLGKVSTTGWNVNPNSGNNLKAWIWTVDWTALQKWASKKRVKPTKVAPAFHAVPAPPPVVPGGDVAGQVNRA